MEAHLIQDLKILTPGEGGARHLRHGKAYDFDQIPTNFRYFANRDDQPLHLWSRGYGNLSEEKGLKVSPSGKKLPLYGGGTGRC